MAETYFFLKIDGIFGDSKDPHHAGWIDVQSFSVGDPRGTSGGVRNGGAGSGKITVSAIYCVIRTGLHTPLLARAANEALHIRSAVLEAFRGTGCKRTLLYRWRFTDVNIMWCEPVFGDTPGEGCLLEFADNQLEEGNPPATPAVQPVRYRLNPSAATTRGLK